MPMKTTPTRSKRQSSPLAKTKRDPLHPDNWDFRWVREASLQDVIHWEYYREANPELSLPPARHLPASHGLFTPAKRSPRALHIIEHDRVALSSLALLPSPQDRFVMRIDFNGHGVNEIIKEFAGWARQEDKRRARPSRNHGRAAAPPWHQLKQLATKRLHDQGISHEQAKQLVAALKSKPGTDSPGDVLPNYASSGGWHDAIKAARQFLEGDPDAKLFVDRIGRRRWWTMFGAATRLAGELLGLGTELILPVPAWAMRRAVERTGPVFPLKISAVHQKEHPPRRMSSSIGEQTCGETKLKSEN